MTDQTTEQIIAQGASLPPVGPNDEFAVQIADQVESFLIALREIARSENQATAVPMLLLEISQLMLAGGRLGAITDVVPVERFEPDTGPDPDLDELRERLGYLLSDVDLYTEVFDPYGQELELLHGRQPMLVSCENRKREFGGAKLAAEMQTKILFLKWRKTPAIIFDATIFLEARSTAGGQPFDRRLDRPAFVDPSSAKGGNLLHDHSRSH